MTSPVLPVDGVDLRVEDLTKRFGRGAREFTAVDRVSFRLGTGETLGLVGESGSGKSTTVRCLMGLERPQAGTLTYNGLNLRRMTFKAERIFRSQVQMVFQDPYSSLDPRMTIGQIVAEPLRVHTDLDVAQRRARVGEILERVGLEPAHMKRFPRSFSGGQRQRIAIARALVVRPRVLVCDEPVSALDVSVQAQVLNLIKDMQQEFALSVLFIAHDLAVVRYLCDRLVILEKGRAVEQGTRDQVYGDPQHPYTRSLLEAVPRADPAGERERRLRRRESTITPSETETAA
ncbi:ABC-type oligopeptide transport system ATPase subunit [Microbacterium sp. BE35]|uniref:ATP-binding cassette domain-containing protein n=1 Tax=Microbacterium sp. BE35 TaxID=2817773 RepID=UPI002856CEC0|nr:ATP-binding cassette domain-containing protein [Microbacterium sp. BE35]MDR7191083.1 ABC-type oligopeptide transport system ATPase subunit [Microbacterium sp. BE35]